MVKYNEQQLNRIFHALADPTRRTILELVSKKECQASELAAVFDMSFPAISKHLKVLERAQLITRTIDGRIHHFQLQEQTMKEAYQWLKFYERFWLQKLDNLDKFLKK